MIGAFWNVRGLNKEGRLQCLTDFVNDNKLDFVGIQETKKESFNESFLKYVHKDFVGRISQPREPLGVFWWALMIENLMFWLG